MSSISTKRQWQERERLKLKVFTPRDLLPAVLPNSRSVQNYPPMFGEGERGSNNDNEITIHHITSHHITPPSTTPHIRKFFYCWYQSIIQGSRTYIVPVTMKDDVETKICSACQNDLIMSAFTKKQWQESTVVCFISGIDLIKWSISVIWLLCFTFICLYWLHSQITWTNRSYNLFSSLYNNL